MPSLSSFSSSSLSFLKPNFSYYFKAVELLYKTFVSARGFPFNANRTTADEKRLFVGGGPRLEGNLLLDSEDIDLENMLSVVDDKLYRKRRI